MSRTQIAILTSVSSGLLGLFFFLTGGKGLGVLLGLVAISAFLFTLLPEPDAGLHRWSSVLELLESISETLPASRVVRTGHEPFVEGVLFRRQIRVTAISGTRARIAVKAHVTSEARARFFAREGSIVADPESDPTTSEVLLSRGEVVRHLRSLLEEQAFEVVEIADLQIATKGFALDLHPTQVHTAVNDLNQIAYAAEQLLKGAISIRPADEETDWSRRLCPYCRDSLGSGARVACNACKTPHHQECFAEATKCTSVGCEETEAYSLGVL